jgi:hypothetical protein
VRKHRIALLGLALTALACSGGTAGPQGVAGLSGTNGTAGTNGGQGPAGDAGPSGPAGPAIVISERAQAGLNISPVPISLTGLDSQQVEQLGSGSYLVNALAGCSDCHNNPVTGAFLGGGVRFSLGASNFVTSRNLTRGGDGGLQLTQSQFITVMRTGQDFRADAGVSLAVMPWFDFRWMSQSDLSAIYAYLAVLPPVDNVVPPDNKVVGGPVPFPPAYNEGAITRLLPPELDATGKPISDPDNIARGLAISPVATPTDLGTAGTYDVTTQALIGRGSYLVNAVGGCNDCHTNPDRDLATLTVNYAQFLTGGAVYPVPPPLAPVFHVTRSMSANLTGYTNGLMTSLAGNFGIFDEILTTGLHVDDTPVTPLAWPMPWQHLRSLVATDLEAIFAYLKALQPIVGPNDKLTQPAARYCTLSTDCRSGESCDTTTNECVGGPCPTPAACGACQACTSNVCVAPSPGSLCLTTGI